MNPKQKAFCEEYIKDFNGTQAAIRAGYAKKSAPGQASRLLMNANVSAEVSRLMAERSKRTKIDADRVLEELGKVAFANMSDYITIGADGDPYVDLSALTPDQAAAIGEVTVEDFTEGRGDDARDVRRIKFKLNDKLRALDLVGKHVDVQAFKERVESENQHVHKIERVIVKADSQQ